MKLKNQQVRFQYDVVLIRQESSCQSFAWSISRVFGQNKPTLPHTMRHGINRWHAGIFGLSCFPQKAHSYHFHFITGETGAICSFWKNVSLRHDYGDIDSCWVCQLESKAFPFSPLAVFLIRIFVILPFAFRHRFWGIALSTRCLFDFFCP